MRSKKLLLILLFLLAVALIGFAIYSVFFKPLIIPTPGEVPEELISKGLPEADEAELKRQEAEKEAMEKGLPSAFQLEKPAEKIPQEEVVSDIARGGRVKTTEITQVPSFGATMSADGRSLNFYDKENGKFYRVDNEGNMVLLSEKTFYNVDNVTWAPDKDKTILEYPDGRKTYYDFKTQKQVTLPSHWEEFNFSPNSNSIAFKSLTADSEDNWLAIANPDGSEPTAIQMLGENEAAVQIAWSPNDQIIATNTQAKDLDRQKVYFIGKNNENYRLMMVDGRDFRPKWFPNGKKLLYSVYSSDDDFKPSLWMVDAIGDQIGNNRVKIDVSTWSDRCAFNESGSTIYCARPKEMPEMAGPLPGLVEQNNISSEIVKINTLTGKVTKVAEPADDMDIEQVFVSKDESNLFFLDKTDQKLKKIDLK